MDKKTIALAVICPVLLGSGCGQEPGSTGGFHPQIAVTGYVQPGPLYPTARPDSMKNDLVWNGYSPLLVVEITDAYLAETGDTLAICSDPFLGIETERIEMELELATALGDTAAADSIRGMLEDQSVFIPLTCPFQGLIEIKIHIGETVEPGDVFAVIHGSPPDSLYMILPGAGHIRWPESIPGCLVTAGGLACTGSWPGDSVAVPGTYRVENQFIHEEGLNTFLLTMAGDTLPVTVLGNRNGFRIVFSPVTLDSLPLVMWD